MAKGRQKTQARKMNRDCAYCTLLCLYPSNAFIQRLRGLEKAEGKKCSPLPATSQIKAPSLIQQILHCLRNKQLQGSCKKKEKKKGRRLSLRERLETLNRDSTI